MAGALLLVGSMPPETAEEVMRAFGGSLGAWLDYLPDGEVGDRRYWIDGIGVTLFFPDPPPDLIGVVLAEHRASAELLQRLEPINL